MLLEAPTQPTTLAPTVGVVELLFQKSRAPVVAVAGASGKSTTARLIAQMLHASGYGVALGLREALSALDALSPEDRVVIELNPSVSVAPMAGPAIIAVTSLAADELPEDQTPAKTASAIRPTVSASTRAVVVNGDDPRAKALAKAASAEVLIASTTNRSADLAIIDGAVSVRDRATGSHHALCRVEELPLAAPAHLQDLLVATAAALAAGGRTADLAGVMRRATAGPDCVETIALRGGVTWISDAKGTRPGRVVTALAAVSDGVLLIAGGRYAGQPLSDWAAAAAARASHVLLYGEADDVLAGALADHDCPATVVRCADLDDAVVAAARLASAGDTVLFSPGCEPESMHPPTPAERFRDLATMPRASRREAA